MNSHNFELLRAIAYLPSEATDRRVRQAAAAVSDWDALLPIAGEHRVLPLLFTRLAQCGTQAPAHVQQRLLSAYERNAFHCLANAAELISLLNVFAQEAISVMPFKGVVLGASIYGDPTRRVAGDLDLLIHRRDVAQATAILRQRGYQLDTPVNADDSPANPDCGEYHFDRPNDGMVTELRWRFELFGRRYSRELGMDWVWPRRRSVILHGAEVPDLDPETTLLTLCMHGSKHHWSRLAWICDVAQLLEARPALDWNWIDREAKRTGLWGVLALGVLLAHRVAGAEVPNALLRKFESKRAASTWAQYIEEHLFDAPGSLPDTAIPFSLQLLDSRDRLGQIFSLAVLRPNERDFAVVKLPRWLNALYYLIRPFRILMDRSPR